jgi:DNA invertase Pin-like site-specific DNA recombinase
MTTKTKQRRAIGIVRVSQVGKREGESFASPDEQRERIEAACERDGMRLLRVVDERDVKGATPLKKRDGLRSAVEAVEHGEADVLVGAYFDRLMRSLKVQAELVERVEAAGGSVLALDTGVITNGSAGQWLSSTLLGAVAEYHGRITAEKTREAQRRAVARGAAPYRNIPPGYRRSADGTLKVHRREAKAVARAFEMRANGATRREIREHLAAHGIKRSPYAIDRLLTSRVVLGEIVFGDLVNREAHPAIVDGALWRRVQKMREQPAPRGKSDRLLARLGILRCATCDAPMIGGYQTLKGKRYPYYRCQPIRECAARANIAAGKAEEAVVRATREHLAHVEDGASSESGHREAQDALEGAEAAVDRARRVLVEEPDAPGARELYDEKRQERDEARERVEQLASTTDALTLNAAVDWDDLALEGKRAVIKATVKQAIVKPGRGEDRVSIQLMM